MRPALLAFAFSAFAFSPASADPPAFAVVDRVEEDWVLLADDTASADGPQVNTVMCPVADLSQPAVVLDVNYRHVPSYAPGGLQIHAYGSYGIFKSNTLATQPLSVAETVRWTQRMTLSGGRVNYLIPSFSSTTWGTSSNNVVLASFDSPLGTLSAYDPDASAANSGGAWRTQGLKSLTLVQVRYYQGDKLLATDPTSRTVDCTRPFTRP